MTLAAVAILASSFTMLFVLQSGYEVVAIQNIADAITHGVDELSTLPGESVALFTFNESRVGIQLPDAIRGTTYRVAFRTNIVFVTRAGVTVGSRFSGPVHLWNPGALRNASYEQVHLADLAINSWSVVSGYDFVALRRYVEGIGFMTFVYTPLTNNLQRYVDEELVPLLDRGESSPGTTSVSVPSEYWIQIYPGIVLLNRTGGGLFVRGFTKADHLWQPTSDRYSDATMASLDASNRGPLVISELTTLQFTVHWAFILRTDHPCEDCPAGYQATPEGFIYP